MDLLIDVQKRVTFGKDSFKTFSLYDLCNNKQGQPTLSEENDPTQIVKKSLGQAVMVDKTLYISGQLGMGKDGNIVGGGTLAQVCQDFLFFPKWNIFHRLSKVFRISGRFWRRPEEATRT